MKLRHLLPALLLATAAGCSSILDTEPGDRIPSEKAITSAATARAALAGAYDGLQDLSYYGSDLFVLADVSSDNAEFTGTHQDLGLIDRQQISAENGMIAGMWEAIYSAIARVNLIIARVPDVPGLGDEERNQILGEAYFLRALHYHNLVKLWGAVPMPLAPVTSPAEAAALTRTPVPDVYTQILADLDQAQALITDESQTRQASRGAVFALRARVLLYKADYAGALEAADTVLAMGYELAPNFADLFDAEGSDTPEDIFRISFTPQEYNEVGYEYLFEGDYEAAPTADLASAFTASDVRLARTLEEEDGEFQGAKFATTIGSEDLHVIRLAEVILIRAEALARLNRLAEAVNAYNLIRVRAHLAPHVLGVDVTTQGQVLSAIWNERRLELALEGDRWPDLVRTGQAAAVLDIPEDRLFQLLYPIPTRERVVSPGLTQNPGY